MYSTTSNIAIKFICNNKKGTESYGKRIFNAIKNTDGEITDVGIDNKIEVITFYMKHTIEIQLGKRESEELPFSFDLLMRLLRTGHFTSLKKITIDNVFLHGENIKILLKTLTNLEEIIITNCRVHYPRFVLNDFGSFPNLKILNLSNNSINEFIMDPIIAPNLIDLDLSLNSLRHIDFGGYECQIKYLNIGENLLYKFPEEILCLSQLVLLNLGGNEFYRVPENISKLINLQSLCLTNNKIKELPDSIKNLTELQELNVSNNILSVLPQLNNLKQLRKLDLSNNCMSQFFNNYTVFKDTSIEELNLSGNKIVTTINNTISDHFKSIKILDVSNNSINSSFFLNNFKNVTEVNISKNKLSTFYLKDSLENLEKLDLSYNDIGTFSDDIINQFNLKILNISNNRITKIPEDKICNLLYLKHFNLRNNKIVDIPESFKLMSSLVSVDISENPINDNKTCNIVMIDYLENLGRKTVQLKDDFIDDPYMVEMIKTIDDITKRSHESVPTTSIDTKIDRNQSRVNTPVINHRYAELDIHNITNNYPLQNPTHHTNPYEEKITYRNGQVQHPKYNLYSQAGYNQSKYSPQKSLISVRTVLINILRDFIVSYPQLCTIEELGFLIENCNYLTKDVKCILISNCENNKIIDGLGKTFTELMCHVFNYINCSRLDDQQLLYYNLNYHLTRFKNCIIEKHIECIVMALDGINDSVTNGVSDIENMITTVMEVRKTNLNINDRHIVLKNKMTEDYYTDAQYNICLQYLK